MAYRAQEKALLTLEEFELLPEHPDFRDELSRGRIVREPRPGHEHGRVQFRLGGRLEQYVREHTLGYVVGESGFVLERNPDTVRGPDIAFVAREHYGDELPVRWLEIAPDLAVEILSPFDRIGALMDKIAQYFVAGCRMVWLIDPAERTATVHKPGAEPRVIHDEDVLSGEDVLPGFTLVLREILD